MDIERFREYAAAWQGRPRREVIEEISSVSHESRRVGDPFVLTLTPQGKLYSPSHKRLVEDVVDKRSSLGKADFAALVRLQEIIVRESCGTALWASPPYGRNEASKLTAYEIHTVKGKKIVFGHAVLLDVGEDELLEIGNRLAGLAGENTRISGIDLRKTPIFINTGVVHWTYVVGDFVESDNWEEIRSKRVWITKRQTLRDSRKLYEEIFPEGTRSVLRGSLSVNRELFGDGSLSCPPKTAFDLLFGLISGETWSGKCPLCGTYNKGLQKGDRCKGCDEVYESCGTGHGTDQLLVINFSQN